VDGPPGERGPTLSAPRIFFFMQNTKPSSIFATKKIVYKERVHLA
jgi:hypothetical protein